MGSFALIKMIETADYPDLTRRGIIETIKRKLFILEDLCFEKKFGADFGGYIYGNELSFASELSVSQATAYQQIWCRSLHELFAEVKKIGIAYDNFIDIGSGKGKACFFAHTNGVFKHIIGIEASQPLISIAETNKKKAGLTDIDFLHIDATDYILPGGASFIFMYNPFGEAILEKFIQNNMKHFKESNSVIAYAYDTQRSTLTRYGFETIYRNQTRKLSIFNYPHKDV